MFTGIIENTATITAITKEGKNLHLSLKCDLTSELKIDQSLAHNGVCLTVIDIKDDVYTVTAIDETLQKTNIGDLKVGDTVNLERAMKMQARLDGHIVQGHVDQKAVCKNITSNEGSWIFTFEYDPSFGNVTIEKGSICVNGVSLTVFDSKDDSFSVGIIPYTYTHTGFSSMKVGDQVNLEFDVIGKYVQRLMRQPAV